MKKWNKLIHIAMHKIKLSIISILLLYTSNSQKKPNGIPGGMYIKQHILTKRMIPYEFVREADVIWSTRIWRSIDLREKINHSMYFPFDYYDSFGNWMVDEEFASLWVILKTYVLNGELYIFSPYNPKAYMITDGDQLKYPILPEAGKNYFSDSTFRNTLFSYLGTIGTEQTTPLSNINGEDSTIFLNGITSYVYPARDTTWIMSKDIIQYHLKEDWFFDKERSVMDVRIIAIAPVIYAKDNQGQITGVKELFWLYFPHCRFILNNYAVFNENNDSQLMSFDDLFWKRRFSSTIYKESNVFDRKIEVYKAGIDALFEAEKIKEEIRTIEHDIWSF